MPQRNSRDLQRHGDSGTSHQFQSIRNLTDIKKSVQTAKSLMYKTSENGDNPYLGLLEYRNIPVDGLAAPAQLLMNRQLQSILPHTTNHLQREVVPEKEFLNSHAERQQQQKSHYDR
ncbi:hypothetical protein QYM36_002271 [Artemia franciscana]|uniref:Uncharacterized protein n=1 Tax=Artemia franciscana TaxID=6661 RepID=A0AA88IC50_ARTSF|nr:hypothetical protein QYM36_002271 [Artemia franciscana]